MGRRFTSLTIKMSREAEGGFEGEARPEPESSFADRARNRQRRKKENHGSRVLAASQHRFCWGYISFAAKYKGGECEECESAIKVGDPCWWHPVIRSMRCWDCRPTHQTFRDNEIVVWHIEVGQYEQWYIDACKAAREDEGDRLLGVAWLAGEEPGYELLDEELGEIAEASPTCEEVTGSGEAATGAMKRETSQLLPSLSEDVRSARKLTRKDELLARPFESVLDDVQKTLEFHVRQAVDKSAGHFDREDLRGAAHLKLVESMRLFSGTGTFGGYLDAVIPNALVDYARKELRHDQGALPLGEDGREESIDSDPTEDWINSMEIQACLAQVRNADLLVLGGMGFLSRELGEKAVVDTRRSRARTTLAEMLRNRGL